MLTIECGLLKKHETDIRGGILQNVSQWWQTMTGWKQGLFKFVAFVVVKTCQPVISIFADQLWMPWDIV